MSTARKSICSVLSNIILAIYLHTTISPITHAQKVTYTVDFKVSNNALCDFSWDCPSTDPIYYRLCGPAYTYPTGMTSECGLFYKIDSLPQQNEWYPQPADTYITYDIGQVTYAQVVFTGTDGLRLSKVRISGTSNVESIGPEPPDELSTDGNTDQCDILTISLYDNTWNYQQFGTGTCIFSTSDLSATYPPTPIPTLNTLQPSFSPTQYTLQPTATPTKNPTVTPTYNPTDAPTSDPTLEPSAQPTLAPSPDTFAPSMFPTVYTSEIGEDSGTETQKSESDTVQLLIVVVIIVTGVLIMVVVVFAACFIKMKKNEQSTDSNQTQHVIVHQHIMSNSARNKSDEPETVPVVGNNGTDEQAIEMMYGNSEVHEMQVEGGTTMTPMDCDV